MIIIVTIVIVCAAACIAAAAAAARDDANVIYHLLPPATLTSRISTQCQNNNNNNNNKNGGKLMPNVALTEVIEGDVFYIHNGKMPAMTLFLLAKATEEEIACDVTDIRWNVVIDGDRVKTRPVITRIASDVSLCDGCLYAITFIMPNDEGLYGILATMPLAINNGLLDDINPLQHSCYDNDKYLLHNVTFPVGKLESWKRSKKDNEYRYCHLLSDYRMFELETWWEKHLLPTTSPSLESHLEDTMGSNRKFILNELNNWERAYNYDTNHTWIYVRYDCVYKIYTKKEALAILGNSSHILAYGDSSVQEFFEWYRDYNANKPFVYHTGSSRERNLRLKIQEFHFTLRWMGHKSALMNNQGINMFADVINGTFMTDLKKKFQTELLDKYKITEIEMCRNKSLFKSNTISEYWCWYYYGPYLGMFKEYKPKVMFWSIFQHELAFFYLDRESSRYNHDYRTYWKQLIDIYEYIMADFTNAMNIGDSSLRQHAFFRTPPANDASFCIGPVSYYNYNYLRSVLKKIIKIDSKPFSAIFDLYDFTHPWSFNHGMITSGMHYGMHDIYKNLLTLIIYTMMIFN